MELRCDDVLQVEVRSKMMRKEINGRDMFELFLRIDREFEKYDYPMILAILSEGIDYYPEWVKHIEKNKYRYRIQVHGSKHYTYSDISEEEGEKDLREAIKKIEDTFGQKITKWHLPYGRQHAPEWTDRVCERLGIGNDSTQGKQTPEMWLYYREKNGGVPYDHVNFHYWYDLEIDFVKEMLKILN